MKTSRSKSCPCTCPAYRWPHRRGGGLCRWPEPPRAEHPTPAGTNRPSNLRRRGARRGLMRLYGLHPIQDRELIAEVLPVLYQADSWQTDTRALVAAARRRLRRRGRRGAARPPEETSKTSHRRAAAQDPLTPREDSAHSRVVGRRATAKA